MTAGMIASVDDLAEVFLAIGQQVNEAARGEGTR